jgi:hypothetical protein
MSSISCSLANLDARDESSSAEYFAKGFSVTLAVVELPVVALRRSIISSEPCRFSFMAALDGRGAAIAEYEQNVGNSVAW